MNITVNSGEPSSISLNLYISSGVLHSVSSCPLSDECNPQSRQIQLKCKPRCSRRWLPRIPVFWDVTSCSLEETYPNFIPTHCLCFQSRNALPSKRQQISTSLNFVNNQLDAQFFFMYDYVYFYSLHVLGSHVPIIRRINCINTTYGICHSI